MFRSVLFLCLCLDRLHSSHIKPTPEYLKKVFIHDELFYLLDDIVHPIAPWYQAHFSIWKFSAIFLLSHEANCEIPLKQSLVLSRRNLRSNLGPEIIGRPNSSVPVLQSVHFAFSVNFKWQKRKP